MKLPVYLIPHKRLFQLDSHFEIGNDSGRNTDKDVYTTSTMKGDFDKKLQSKEKPHREEKSINWTDMAPRYFENKTLGTSEYANCYMNKNRSLSAPVYPRVNTSKMALPMDQEQFGLQKKTNFSLGSDKELLQSENQRAYTCGARNVSCANDSNTISRMMKNMECKSNVFRKGDYNGIVGNITTSTTLDYGPRTRTRAEIVSTSLSSEDKEQKDKLNELAEFARCHTHPKVTSDARDEKKYQTSSHFQFGSGGDKSESIYIQDFAHSSMVERKKPVFHVTPSAGNVMHKLTEYSKTGKSTYETETNFPRGLPFKNREGKTALEINMEKETADNVHLHSDPNIHAEDRQKSVAQSDYAVPPEDFKAMEPKKEQCCPFNILSTNDALPYPGLSGKESETKIQQNTRNFLEGSLVMEKRRLKEKLCRTRVEDTRATHFTVGYSNINFDTEAQRSYSGKPDNSKNTPTAGIKEIIPETQFQHLQHTSNIKDMASYRLRDRRQGVIGKVGSEKDNSFLMTVMKNDYTPLASRGLTEPQTVMVHQNMKLEKKPISASHFFHTDNNGNDNFVSTAMSDYIKPNSMTGGQKMLAAR